MFHQVVARFAIEAFGQSHLVLTFACVVSAAVRSYPVQDSKHMVAVHDVLLALNQGQTAQDVHKLQFADEADSSHYVPEKAFMNLDALDSLKAARLKVRQAVDFVTALDDLSDKARNSTTRLGELSVRRNLLAKTPTVRWGGRAASTPNEWLERGWSGREVI